MGLLASDRPMGFWVAHLTSPFLRWFISMWMPSVDLSISVVSVHGVRRKRIPSPNIPVPIMPALSFVEWVLVNRYGGNTTTRRMSELHLVLRSE